MKKIEELERPMICPFRSETHYDYANIDGSAIVIDTQTETFPECYGNQCPLYKYEVGRGFYCAQADTMGGGTEEDERADEVINHYSRLQRGTVFSGTT